MPTTLRVVILAGCLALAPAAVEAQVWIGGAKPRAGSVEASGGGNWTGGQSLPEQAATLTGNPGTGSGAIDLFNADPSLDQAFGVHGAVGVYITRALAIEGGVQISRPKLTVRLSDDFEGADDVTASTTITSYLFTGSLVYHFGTGKTVPFIAGGAGHLRDVHSGNESVETGIEYHGKAGVKMWFGRVRKYGLRLEGGVSVRDGGVSYEDDRRIAPLAAGSFLYLF